MSRGEFIELAGWCTSGAILASYLHPHNGYHLECPTFALTGFPCPLCGSTRSATALVWHGDWQTAFILNPVVPVTAILLAAISLSISFGVRLPKNFTFLSLCQTIAVVALAQWIIRLATGYGVA